MFRKTLPLIALLFMNCCQADGLAQGSNPATSLQPPMGDDFVYVGSYTNPTSASKGIYGFRFDSKTGALTSVGVVAETVNPAHLWPSRDGRFLYAVNWQTGDTTN